MPLKPQFKTKAEDQPSPSRDEGYILVLSGGIDIALMPNMIENTYQSGSICYIRQGNNSYHIYGALPAVLRAITAAKSGAQIDLREFCKNTNKSLILEDDFDDSGRFTQRPVKVDKLEKIAKSGYR